MIGWSELIFGSMYCGKSEELIRRLKRVKIAGKKYQLFKPALDDRYGVSKVATHDNYEMKKRFKKILDTHIDNDIRQLLLDKLSDELSNSLTATVVANSTQLLTLVDDDTEVVGIDEVQFFDENLVEAIDMLIESGRRVICCGLDLYASGEPFPIVAKLACKCKYVEKFHAVCVECGISDAQYSYKISDNESNKTSKVEVGSEGKYIALCGSCRAKRMEP